MMETQPMALTWNKFRANRMNVFQLWRKNMCKVYFGGNELKKIGLKGEAYFGDGFIKTFMIGGEELFIEYRQPENAQQFPSIQQPLSELQTLREQVAALTAENSELKQLVTGLEMAHDVVSSHLRNLQIAYDELDDRYEAYLDG